RMVEPLFDWSSPQELDLKGKSARVLAYEAVGARPIAPRTRLRGIQAPLVGRDRELALVKAALDDVLSGSGGILVISGEAGIGKSRLLAELRDLAEAAETQAERPALWLEGRCVSYGQSLPYWPFRDLVRGWLGAGVDDPELKVRIALRRSVEGLFGQRALEFYPYLGAMLGLALEPDAVARLAELSPEALQYRTFEVIGALLARLAQDGPVTMAIDDLHWADPTSIQLAERLLPLSEDAAVLLVITMRPERDHASWQVKEVAARALPHRTREVALEALSGDADRDLLDAVVGPDTLPSGL